MMACSISTEEELQQNDLSTAQYSSIPTIRLGLWSDEVAIVLCGSYVSYHHTADGAAGTSTSLYQIPRQSVLDH